MNKEEDYMKDLARRDELSRKDAFESWVIDLEESEQPDACNIDDSDCEACGS
jgi:hypothetical protein|tara:strand:+ start:408 stop:563 length:156 start_codon:yes stop_codon:yes gene_type:complete